MSEQIFSIPAENLNLLQAQLDKLSKKALKLGAEPMRLEVLSSTTEPVSQDFVRTYYQVMLVGTAPKIGSWEVITRIDHDVDRSGKSNIVHKFPQVTLDPKWFNAPSDCHHCNRSRWRRDTYILRNNDGSEIQVGRTCLQDFTGINPDKILAALEILRKLTSWINEYDNTYQATNRWLSTKRFIAWVVATADKFGWVSAATARSRNDGTVPTAQTALNEIFYADKMPPAWSPTDEHVQKADVIMAWALTLDPANDFIHNLVTNIKNEYMDIGMANTVGAVVGMYQRDVGTKKADTANSNYVGKINERIQTEVTVLANTVYQGSYGTSSAIRMIDTAGNCLVTFSTGNFNPQVGAVIRITGTVRKHQEFKGVKQTVLNRVKETS